MNDIWIYELELGGGGIVKADSEDEAKTKVYEAYKKHSDLSFSEEIKIYNLDERWFADCPDVVEVYEY